MQGGRKAITFVFGILSLFLFLRFPMWGADNSDETNANVDALKKLLDVKISSVSKYSQKLGEVPASVTIITSEEIERFGYRTLDDVLMGVRGFFLTNDLNYIHPGVRGISKSSIANNRIIVLINGILMSENIFGAASLIGTGFGIDVDAIDRVEIIRGPASALYGSNAMLALINVITKTGKAEDGMHGTLLGGSPGKWEIALRGGKELKHGLDLFLNAHMGAVKGRDYYFKEFDDPSTHDGVINDMDRDRYNGLFAALTYKNFSFQGLSDFKEKYIPTAPFGTLFNDPRTKSQDYQQFLELKYSSQLTYNKKIFLRFYYGSYVCINTYPYPVSDIVVLGKFKSTARWYGAEGQFCWDIQSNNRLILGLEYKNNFKTSFKCWDNYGNTFNKDYPYHAWSYYLQDEHQFLGNLFLTLGIRRDKNFTGERSLSPQAALVYNPFRTTTLKLLYGIGFRVPTFFELFYAFGQFRPYIGDEVIIPDVKAEKVYTLEAVIEQKITEGVAAILSLYRLKMKGMIDLVLNPENGFLQFRNAKDVRSKGIEAGLNVCLTNGLTGYINVALQRSIDMATHQEIPNSPPSLLKAGLSIPLSAHASASLELFRESGRRTQNGTRLNPFFLTNLHVSTSRLFGLSNRFRFSFLIKNLFDTQYQIPGGFEHRQNALIQPGRTISLKVEYDLFK
ncbi:MAG: TonB-dependent receptor plug domain-containing protein [Candidatus Omnitrophota bacterium]